MPSPSLDFTAREFDTNLQALIDSLKRESPENWNSFYEGDLGKIILDLVAHDNSMLSFVADMAARESFVGTHKTVEGRINFCDQTGYRVRGATPASVELYCQASSNTSSITILKGQKIRSSNGLVWETVKDRVIESGNFTPVVQVLKYGDLLGNVIAQDGSSSRVKALISIKAGSSQATLVNTSGLRFPPDVKFTSVSEGNILKLTDVLNQQTGQFSGPPGPTNREYAVIGVGKLADDVTDGSVLFLDRVWDQDFDFIGKWEVENRSIEVIQGETFQESFLSPVTEDRFGWSIRTAFYPVITAAEEVTFPSGFFGRDLDGVVQKSGIEVYVNGIRWEEVSNLIFESPGSRAYQLSLDELNRAIIKFGDGRFGQAPPAGASVEIKYRVGGGKDGNLAQGSFNTSIQGVTDSGSPVTIYVSNPYTVGRGGQDQESPESIRSNIQLFLRANNRAVCSADYDYLASNFVDPNSGRIKFAKATLHQNLVPREQNIVWVHAWSEGANGQLAKPNTTLKRRLKEYLDARRMIGDEVVILDGQTTSVPIEIRYKYATDADGAVVQESLRTVVNTVFKNLLPGDRLPLSRLYEAIESVTSLERANLYSPYEDIGPSSEYVLLANSVQPAARTSLSVNAYRGDLVISVVDPSIFSVGGLVSIFEFDRSTTCATIVSISGNLIQLRQDSPLVDSYTGAASVVNSDWYVIGWQYERPVNVYVTYNTLNGDSILHVGQQIKKRLHDYFSRVISVEEPVVRATLQEMVSTISGVTTYSVNLGSVDGTAETVSMTAREKAVLGKVVINGTDF